MISQETASSIWRCYREIEASEKLMAETEKLKADNVQYNPKEPFFNRRGIEMGVPSGDGCSRIFHVSHDLALSVIRANIADMKSRLAAANEQARIELRGPQNCTPEDGK